MDSLDTSRPKIANSNMSCCDGSMGASDPSNRTAASAGMPGRLGALDRLRPLLSDRRVLIFGAIVLAVIGMWANWGWVVALGLAPLILAFAPCAIMCAFGFCMMGKGMGGKSSEKAGSPPNVVPKTAADTE